MKPEVSIIIPTLGRETLYPLLEMLLNQEVEFSFEIILIPQIKLKEELLSDERIKYFYEPLGKGFAYYRNAGIKKSRGKVLAFIDDDELPMNCSWLKFITNSIINGEFKVATSGVYIKLGEGYVTDSISLLGFPGGGAIGFKTMWRVDENDITEHLSAGNLAIDKTLMNKLNNFSNEYRLGQEDVNLSDKLKDKNIKVKYIDEATVYHVARKGFIRFIQWNILRGKAAKIYISHNKGGSRIMNRLSSSLKILKIVSLTRTRYLPGVILMMLNLYFWQFWGALTTTIFKQTE